MDLELRRARKRRRQNRQLHGVRDVELLAQGLELVLGRQRLAHDPGMPEGLVDCGLEVVEVDRLGHEVERAPVHRGADVVHVAVGGDHHRPDLGIHLAERVEERKAVEPRHVDVGEDHLELGVLREPLQGLEPVLGERELELAAPDAAAELLADEDLEIGLVVHDEDFGGPAVHFFRGVRVHVRHGGGNPISVSGSRNLHETWAGRRPGGSGAAPGSGREGTGLAVPTKRPARGGRKPCPVPANWPVRGSRSRSPHCSRCPGRRRPAAAPARPRGSEGRCRRGRGRWDASRVGRTHPRRRSARWFRT